MKYHNLKIPLRGRMTGPLIYVYTRDRMTSSLTIQNKIKKNSKSLNSYRGNKSADKICLNVFSNNTF